MAFVQNEAISAVATLPEESNTLDLEIVHGDLRLHDAAIIVGHLVGTGFDGAEHALDSASGGLLTYSSRLGVYAGAPGTVFLRRLTGRSGPPWAITIGMGEIGEFNASILRRGISEACLRMAVALHDTDRSDLLRLTVAPVLIGVGTGGIRIEDSLSAMVNGVFDANRRLRTAGLHDTVRISKLEVVELFEDLAIHTHRAARDLGARFAPRPTENLTLAPYVRTGPGGRPGLPSPGYRDGAWQTVTVQAMHPATPAVAGSDEVIDLVFTAVGGRARVEEALSTSQRAQIDRLIEGAINSPDHTEQGPNTLYELLLPPTLKAGLEQPGNLMFVLDPEAAPYPWELLAPRMRSSDIEPLAAQAGLLRRLRTTQFRKVPRSGAGPTALVIGDPPSQLPPLPGAQEEANRVADLLADEGWKVHRLIAGGPHKVDANQVLNALFADDYRVIHIAAHGAYDAQHPLESGVVIGDGRYLTSLEFAAMANAPEFVFLNCCYLATIDTAPAEDQRAGAYGQFHRFAASVSQQLIQNGVRAIAAAGWAVDDAAALEFATHLYGKLLHGVGFGDAVKDTRSQVRTAFLGQNNTWGAYQCYGPPAFKLGYAPHEQPPESAPASPGDLNARLRTLVKQAETAPDGAPVDAVAAHVERLLAGDLPDGFVGGEQLHTAGVVYLHLGMTDTALEYLTKARRALGVRAPLTLAQHLVAANLTAAGDRLRTGDLPAARQFMQQAEACLATIQSVIADAEDATVWRLAAECALRGALVDHSDARSAPKARTALEYAERAYRNVFELANGPETGLDYRAGFDVLFCRTMLDLAPLEGDPTPAALSGRAASQRTGGAWRLWAPAYQALAEAMAAVGSDTFGGDEAVIAALFSDALDDCPSRRERLAIRDHLEVLAAFTPGERSAALARLLAGLFGKPDPPVDAPALTHPQRPQPANA